jgi:hypothetical protein
MDFGANKFDFKNIMNVPENLIAPYYGTDRIFGQTYVILFETIVENILRRLISRRVPVMETALGLALGKPFEGMLYFGEEPPPFSAQGVSMFTNALVGLQTAPGQWMGQYILETFRKGFHFPRGDIVDALIVSASKALSRPLMGFASGFMPKNLNDQLAVVNALLRSQRNVGLSSMLSAGAPQKREGSGGQDMRL